jgi:exopolysaccharide production protein ExoZ
MSSHDPSTRIIRHRKGLVTDVSGPQRNASPGTISWTLTYELYFYLVLFLLLFAPQRIAPWLLALWGIAVVGLKLRIGLSPHALVQVLINPSVLEFLAGCFLFHIYRRSRLHRAAGILIVLTALLWLAGVLAYGSHAHPGQPTWIQADPWLRIFLYGTFATLFLLGAIELERTTFIRYFPLLASLGDWSYSIYLSHVLVLELIGRIAFRLLPHRPDSILIITLIGLPSTILVGYLSYAWIERPLMTPPLQTNPTPTRSLSEITHEINHNKEARSPNP